jgi:hypothetical protein
VFRTTRLLNIAFKNHGSGIVQHFGVSCRRMEVIFGSPLRSRPQLRQRTRSNATPGYQTGVGRDHWSRVGSNTRRWSVRQIMRGSACVWRFMFRTAECKRQAYCLNRGTRGRLSFASIGDSKTGCQSMILTAFVQHETVLLQKSIRWLHDRGLTEPGSPDHFEIINFHCSLPVPLRFLCSCRTIRIRCRASGAC